MSATTGTAMDKRLLTWGDLEQRWQPVGETSPERQRHLQRMARTWGLKAMRGTRGATARFHPADVVAAEATAAGRRAI